MSLSLQTQAVPQSPKVSSQSSWRDVTGCSFIFRNLSGRFSTNKENDREREMVLDAVLKKKGTVLSSKEGGEEVVVEEEGRYLCLVGNQRLLCVDLNSCTKVLSNNDEDDNDKKKKKTGTLLGWVLRRGISSSSSSSCLPTLPPPPPPPITTELVMSCVDLWREGVPHGAAFFKVHRQGRDTVLILGGACGVEKRKELEKDEDDYDYDDGKALSRWIYELEATDVEKTNFSIKESTIANKMNSPKHLPIVFALEDLTRSKVYCLHSTNNATGGMATTQPKNLFEVLYPGSHDWKSLQNPILPPPSCSYPMLDDYEVLGYILIGSIIFINVRNCSSSDRILQYFDTKGEYNGWRAYPTDLLTPKSKPGEDRGAYYGNCGAGLYFDIRDCLGGACMPSSTGRLSSSSLYSTVVNIHHIDGFIYESFAPSLTVSCAYLLVRPNTNTNDLPRVLCYFPLDQYIFPDNIRYFGYPLHDVNTHVFPMKDDKVRAVVKGYNNLNHMLVYICDFVLKELPGIWQIVEQLNNSCMSKPSEFIAIHLDFASVKVLHHYLLDLGPRTGRPFCGGHQCFLL